MPFTGDAGYGALTHLTSAKPLCRRDGLIVSLMFYRSGVQPKSEKPAIWRVSVGRLLLPSALFVAVRLEAFPAFVLRHLQAALLLEISHGESWFLIGQTAIHQEYCKA